MFERLRLAHDGMDLSDVERPNEPGDENAQQKRQLVGPMSDDVVLKNRPGKP